MKLSRVNGGRTAVHAPGHRGANNRGYVPLAWIVAEQKLGRPLQPGEVVHHKNHDKTDDRPENIEVLTSESAHRQQHWDDGTHARKLDYEAVRRLVEQGHGHKKISKLLGYPLSSVKYAVRKIRNQDKGAT